MAIVNLKSTLFGSLATGAYVPPYAAQRDGQQHRIAGRVTNAATDNSGSTYLIAEIPWTAIILHDSTIRTDNWGFANAQIGVIGALTGLYSAAKGASATGVALFAAYSAKWNLPLWGQLGLSALPLTPVAQLMFTSAADAAGAGTADFDIRYCLHL